MHDITVNKFIALNDILTASHYESEIDRNIDLLACITGKDREYYESLTMHAYKKECERLAFLTLESIEGKPKRYIKANGKIYAPIYDFRKLTAGQLVDVTHFTKESAKIIDNLPKILASICVPTKKTFTGRKKLPYLSTEHEDVAADMGKASFFDAYSIALFFWAVYNGSMQIIGNSLVKKILAKKKAANQKLTEQERAAILTILKMYGGGITVPNVSQK